MLLKRIYHHDAHGHPTTLSHVEVKHTGPFPEQNFSHRLVNTGIAEGWMTLSRGELLIHAGDEDVVYTINRIPGRYCCHCGSSLAGEGEARAHVAAEHAGVASPDPQNPA